MTFKANPRFEAEFRRGGEFNRFMQGTGEVLLGFMRPLTPYDTGTLVRSEGFAVEDGVLYAFANTDYAAFVEGGTRYMAAQPYGRPALMKLRSRFRG